MTLTKNCIKFLKQSAEKLNQLVFLPEIGVGYYPVTDSPYNKDYFEKYLKMDETSAGFVLTRARMQMVAPHKGTTIDIGIGGGRFVKDFNCFGYDINPEAVKWLKDKAKYRDPYQTYCTNLTFWDSLEHIHDPETILHGSQKNVFISMPIYSGAEHVLKSKHFRKDEHCWYFTDKGLKLFMGLYGFKFVSKNKNEQPIREDIVSYHFERV